MKSVICLVALLLTTTIVQSQDISGQLYSEIEQSFHARDWDLEKTISELEKRLIRSQVISNDSWKTRKDFLQELTQTNIIPSIDNSDSIVFELRSQLSFEFIADAVDNIKSTNPLEFQQSTFHNILTEIESIELSRKNNLSLIVRKVLSQLSDADHQHPFYRVLFFMIVSNMNDLYYNSTDIFLKNETDYQHFFGSKDYTIPVSELRNILTIRVNEMGHVTAHGKKLSSILKLSPEITNYFNINRDLTKTEIRSAIRNKEREGYTFPFYSNTTLEEYTAYISEAKKALELAESANASEEEIKNKRYVYLEWQRRKQMLLLYGKNTLPEINAESYIEIFTSPGTRDFTLLSLESEITRAFSQLRNSESKKLFERTYDELYLRHNFLLNDFARLHLIEVLFPMRIMVNRTNFASPPPIIEEIND